MSSLCKLSFHPEMEFSFHVETFIESLSGCLAQQTSQNHLQFVIMFQVLAILALQKMKSPLINVSKQLQSIAGLNLLY